MRKTSQLLRMNYDASGSRSRACSNSQKKQLREDLPGNLTKMLAQYALADTERANIENVVLAIFSGDLKRIETIVRLYVTELEKFMLMHQVLMAILPALTYGQINIIPTQVYSVQLDSGRRADMVNLAMHVVSSKYVIGIPTHPALDSEVFEMNRLDSGTTCFDVSLTEARWVLKHISGIANALPQLPPPLS